MSEESKNNITYFAETNFRNEKRRFGIKRDDRRKHAYVIGKTGMGKTTMLENMAMQDILNGEGVGFLDPHGDTAEKLLDFVPEHRIKDVLYFAPSDIDFPIAFNVMEDVGQTQRHLVASGMMAAFKKIWPDVWSARMEYILSNCILALLEYPDSTILGINRMLSDKDYRNTVVNNVGDTVVKAFWTDEFAKYSDKFMTEAGAAIQNKIGQLISNPLIRNIVGQPKSAFDIRKLMDEKKIVIMNLSKGRMGEGNSSLIGAMLITKIYLGAMSRVDMAEQDRADFYLYVDEFQNFATESFKDILSEARKYRLNLTLAHQYVAQMDEKVRDAVFGNVGTIMSFRVGAYDAELLEKEFSPEFTALDIVNLGFASIYLRLMINGMASRSFSARTLPPIVSPGGIYTKEIIEFSRKKYATPRAEVEADITKWHEPVEATKLEGGKSSGSSSQSQPEMHPAECSVCGKKTYVPFKPEEGRSIFCKTHRSSGERPVSPASLPRSAGPTPPVSPAKPAAISSVPPAKPVASVPTVAQPSVVPAQKQTLQAPQISQDKKPVFVRPTTRPSSPKPSFPQNKGRIIPQRKTISLNQLNDKKTFQPRMDELRKVLDEVMAGKGKEKTEIVATPTKPIQDISNKKTGVLKPGESVKINNQ